MKGGYIDMRQIMKILICLFATSISLSAMAAPKHAFKTTYDDMFQELPNVASQLAESRSDDGGRRWVGNVSVGSSAAVVQVNGVDKKTITGLTVILLFTTNTVEEDYDRAEALRNVLFQSLVGTGEAFDGLNDFFIEQQNRQQNVLKAGGSPKRASKNIGSDSARLSVELAKAPQGLMAIYSLQLI